jgi:dTDP-4-dehydrorhamnose reductase
MLRLSEQYDEIKVVDDQHGRPTSCIDLSEYIAERIKKIDDDESGGIYHFSSPLAEFSITWADFAERIFAQYGKKTTVVRIATSEFPTKAKRPEWSVLIS